MEKDYQENHHLRLAASHKCRILEGHVVLDHKHMLMVMPPKYSIAELW